LKLGASLLALSGQSNRTSVCPLLGAKTWAIALQMSAFDPKRTLAITGYMMNNATVNGESHGNVDAQIAGKAS
jgi:hypothetical protein